MSASVAASAIEPDADADVGAIVVGAMGALVVVVLVVAVPAAGTVAAGAPHALSRRRLPGKLRLSDCKSWVARGCQPYRRASL